MAIGSDLRVLLGALAGVGTGGVLLLSAVPLLAPVEPTRTATVARPAAEPASAPAPDTEIPESDLGPRFDTVRVAPDGSGVVAGQADPGASVAVLADEDVAAEVTADEDGRFVAFLDLSPSVEPRALTLRDEGGAVSEETVIVAPTGGQVADAGSAGGAEEVGLPSGASTAVGAAPPSGATAEVAPEEAGEVSGPPATVSPEPPRRDVAVAGDAGPPPPVDGGAIGSPVASAPHDASAPEVGLAEPAGNVAPPGEGSAPAAGSAGQGAPSGVLAATGPVAASPDQVPEHGPAPSVAGGPAEPPVPEGGKPGQAAVLLSDAEGVRVLQPALAPGADAETLATVALDAISYGGEGEVELAGRASGGGAVRLYLDNVMVADVPVGPDGQWAATLTGTEPGAYTLRVDQVDAGGQVLSRIETPFRREGQDDLDAVMAEAQRPGQTIAVRTVQPGNTLWAIARDRYGEPLMYVQVFEMNRDRIRNPDLIYPGQVFVLPAMDGR
ncbi:hypothetical protein Rumeso_01301 [Rubellimicrobium mesophilum DSM 19309]|uniref:LysM domain-containing protein n=1 Tax=Rubellimicrobium mesophilum DSM 19309 TaxID=442562 RepID=A0A017HRF9_9RHOB|nr:Ig-like domain-containing protein [Rubellimicrobium mesophilum]EYD77042.1 hypothetical protein Rumeso_01301 [Rubellimicrobium mesophilum DSM 19309]